ncbi:MAG: hypothetical protein ACRC8S_03230 [Fimbriiglobus sp.]
MDHTQLTTMTPVQNKLAGLLDPLTAKEYRLVPLAIDDENRVFLGTYDSRMLPDTTSELLDSPSWLRKHIGLPLKITRITQEDWENRFQETYVNQPELEVGIATPVTDVLKRVIFVQTQRVDAKESPSENDWLVLLQEQGRHHGFDLFKVESVDSACELIASTQEFHHDLLVLSEYTIDFFGAKSRLEKIANDKQICELQVIGAESVRRRMALVSEFFRAAA